MKKILFITSLVLSSLSFAQKPMSVAEEICMPADVAKKVMMDLSRLDSTTAVLQLEKSENQELKRKIVLQNNIIVALEQKNDMSQQIINKTNEKFQIVDNINKDLTTEVKRLKRKNTIIEIVSGVLISGLTYGLLTK
jgi:hypothetical protein